MVETGCENLRLNPVRVDTCWKWDCELLVFVRCQPTGCLSLPQRPIQEIVELAAAESWIHKPSEVEVREADGNRPQMVVKRNWCSCREDADTLVEKPPGTYRVVVWVIPIRTGSSRTQIAMRTCWRDCSTACRRHELRAGRLVALSATMDLSHPLSAISAGLAGRRILCRQRSLGSDAPARSDSLEQVGDQYVHAGPTWRPDLTREQSAFKSHALSIQCHLPRGRPAPLVADRSATKRPLG